MQDYIFLDCLRLEEPTTPPTLTGRRGFPPATSTPPGPTLARLVSPVAPPPISLGLACKTGRAGASAGSSGLCCTGDGEADVESGLTVDGGVALGLRSRGSVAVAELHGDPPCSAGEQGEWGARVAGDWLPGVTKLPPPVFNMGAGYGIGRCGRGPGGFVPGSGRKRNFAFPLGVLEL